MKGNEWEAVQSFTGPKRKVSVPGIMAGLLFTAFHGKLEVEGELGFLTERLENNVFF